MTYALIGFFSAAWFGQDTQGNILQVSSPHCTQSSAPSFVRVSAEKTANILT